MSRFRAGLHILWGVFLVGCLICATGPTGSADAAKVSEGEVYGVTKGSFRGRWWNYYERGTSYSDGQFWKEAEADLREAISQRDQDQRRARTYGMHFVDYYPHRELGVVLFHQNRFHEALVEFETSLKTEKSAKAEFYLDRTRKSMIEKQNLDTLPPQIQLDTPGQDELTNGFSTVVAGTARDDSYVKGLQVNGMPVRIDLAEKQISFRESVPLKIGMNVIRVTAVDLSGKSSVAEKNIRVDREGPILSIDEPLEGSLRPRSGLRLRGYVYDDSGLQEIKVNGLGIPFASGREVRLDYPIPAEQNLQSVLLEAKDRAGNQTRAEIRLSGGTSHARKVFLASLDMVHLALLGKVNVKAEDTPPVIELKDWTENQTVFLDQIYLEGSVRDDGGVSSLSINGQSILRRPGKNVYFGYLSKLDEGENLFKIAARDTTGNQMEKLVRINRKLQKVRELGSRLSVALLPFERKEAPGPMGGAVEESLLGALVERGRFDMVERRRLEEILREQKLSSTDLVDPAAAVRVGKIMAANGVLMGSVVEKEGTMDIYVRLVDTETSLIVTAVDVYGEDVDPLILKQLCQGLILKLCDELPMAEGLVVQVKGKQMITDLGKESHVKKGMRLIIFREGEPIRHPATGAVLGTDVEELGYALIQGVQEQMSQVEVISKEGRGPIEPSHKVITQ